MEAELLIKDLETKKFSDLVRVLEKHDRWMQVAKISEFSASEIRDISESTSPRPAEKLLKIFITRCWKIKLLKCILERCELYSALDIISKPEPMKIVSQPTSILSNNENILTLTRGAAFELRFDVTGIPRPKYRWYKKKENMEDQVLQEENSCTLRYNNFVPQMEGKYFCLASQNEKQIASEIVQVSMKMEPCTIVKNLDKSVSFCEGSSIVLKIRAVGYPEPNYQWYWKNRLLENETGHLLIINNATRENGGEYKCQIRNQINEINAETKVFIYSETINNVYTGPVSDKVALLISNDEYENIQSLQNPSDDVSTIALILKALHFRTLCFHNLNLKEIKVALQFFADVVGANAIVFFYYAGHGFEMGDKFLLPIDCPKWDSLKMSDAVPESLILNQVLNQKPILFIVLLDMCLRMPERLENSSIYGEAFAPHEFRSNRNLIRAYSTTSNLPAYDVPGSTNGIYVNALRKRLIDDVPILTILSQVNAEISKICPQQMPSVSYNTAQAFYLSCQILDEQKVPKQEHFEKLNIENEVIVINDTTIRLQMYKQVFNNFIQVDVSKNLFECRLLPSFMLAGLPIKKTENNQTVLQFPNLQRIRCENQFLIEFKIKNTTVTTCRDLDLNFFADQ